MPLPADATKVYLDSASDDPKQARSELADLVDKFNALKAALGTVVEKNTGTSGDAVPLLNADATFSEILTLSKQLRLSGILSPSQITADQNNYAPTNISNNMILRLTTDASRTITGITTGANGRLLFILNIGSNDLVLAHQSSSSDAGNRIITNDATDLTIQSGHAVALIYDATSSRWRVIASSSGGASKVAIFRHEETSGTGGGTADPGSWETRTLNATQVNEISGVALSSANEVTLPAGTYRFSWAACAYNVQRFQTRLANTDDSSYVYGLAVYAARDAGAGGQGTATSVGEAILTIAATKTFELQQRVGAFYDSDGYGVASSFGGTEVYATLKVEKIN